MALLSNSAVNLLAIGAREAYNQAVERTDTALSRGAAAHLPCVTATRCRFLYEVVLIGD
jgi:hypothetical protein